ncbi:MAG: hypothetical protein BECKG1743D_GA0114223_106522 [Candidatus Kentron sp. G]|nr:MAG: hypothetical protein BECKG1743F_GA0114225_107811 [Candidatus Kentron sp. G]VFN04953.1 MAG: hypothetical protein BECKG1743D_GA0114223_106522 [Candidatus Kentron sp. G]VFN05861.1 MAG: hypothetical protein BECKG1743E_GA0114224_109291 [Candidatus Kentron sp. G]
MLINAWLKTVKLQNYNSHYRKSSGMSPYPAGFQEHVRVFPIKPNVATQNYTVPFCGMNILPPPEGRNSGSLFLSMMSAGMTIAILYQLVERYYHGVANFVSQFEVNAKAGLCPITRQKRAKKRSYHGINEHFEHIFNAVRECEATFAYSSRWVNYFLWGA